MTSLNGTELPIPSFESEEDEHEFWQNHDSSEVIDWQQAHAVMLPRLKPTLRTISLRLPESMLAHLKVLANKRDVPYQSLLKIFLAERIEQELSKSVRGKSKSQA